MIDPTQQAAQPGAASGAAPGAAGGTVVCIAAQPDGTFTVYPEGQAAAGQPFQDIDQALEAAETALTGQDDGDGKASSAEDEANAMFKGGFAQARGNPLNRGEG